jgi:DNA-directed RNA polymerase subunit RPC12/RpoP
MVSSLLTLTDRIRREFTELPGLKLTPAQACRLWHVNEDACLRAMTSLITEGFLRQMPSGAFIALPSPRGRSAKAPLADPSSRPARCPHCHHLNSISVERTVTARETSATFRCAACSRVFGVTELSA